MSEVMRNRLTALLFCLAVFFCYPLVWQGARHFAELTLFVPYMLALLAVLLLTAEPEKLNDFLRADEKVTNRVLLGMVPAGVVVFLHYYFLRGNNVLLLTGIYYFALPLLGALYYRSFKKFLLWMVLAIGTINLVFLLSARLDGVIPFGLTGNWNWSCALLVVTGAAVMPFCRRGIYKILVVAVTLGAVFWLFGNYVSRGAMLGTLVAAAVVAVVRGGRHRKLIMVAAAALLVLGLIFLARHGEAADRVRTNLWTAAVELIKSKPLLGSAPGLVESGLSEHIPAEYYMLPLASDRHNHPHNEVLYWGCMFGLGGILLFLIYLYAAWMGGRKLLTAREGRAEETAILFIFVMLAVHGQVDVLLNNWPLNTIFLLSAGVLWGYAADNGKKAPPAPELELSNVQWPLRAVQILLLTGLAILGVRELLGSLNAREAILARETGDRETAAAAWRKSLSYKETAGSLYALALDELYEKKSPQKAQEFLSRLRYRCGFENYMHNNQLMGRALAADGKGEEALKYFDAEQRCYKLGVGNLFLQEQVLRGLKREDEAKAKRALAEELLKKKNLKMSDVPKLIRNPSADIPLGSMR